MRQLELHFVIILRFIFHFVFLFSLVLFSLLNLIFYFVCMTIGYITRTRDITVLTYLLVLGTYTGSSHRGNSGFRNRS